jgi:hypothetical protein
MNALDESEDAHEDSALQDETGAPESSIEPQKLG